MRIRFLAKYPKLGTRKNPAPVSALERSPYYWWYEYLRRNNDYLQCCKAGGDGPLSELYADFGDVREDFRVWWGGKRARGAHLFGEQPMPNRMVVLRSRSDWRDEWAKGSMVTVAFNTNAGTRKLQKYLATLLREQFGRKRGRRAMRTVESSARYPLFANFSVAELKKIVAVYDLAAANSKTTGLRALRTWQIGEQLRLVRTAMPSARDTRAEILDKRRSMSASVCKYKRLAAILIENVGYGEFPRKTRHAAKKS